MAKNNLYFEDDCDIKTDNSKKHKKSRKAGKTVLTVVGVTVLALATFLITVKVSNPNIKLTELLPVTEFKDAFSRFETTENSVTVTKTETTTQPEYNAPEKVVDYLPFSEFEFNTSIQGNSMGNLLNGGLVGTDMTYEYHIVQGNGIYRLNPTTEECVSFYKTKNELSTLNLRGEYLYFINNNSDELCKLKKGETTPEILAKNVSFVYVYDDTVYYVTNSDSIYITDTQGENSELLYTCNKGTLRFAGVSVNGVFFTVSADNNIDYCFINTKNKKLNCFRETTQNNELIKLYIENGFMYYYEKQVDGEYNLCRQKFGSDKIVTLTDSVNTQSFPIVDSNKLFYSRLKKEKYQLVELNMNSNEEKIMMTVSKVKADNDLNFYHGGEYDFIIGKKSESVKVYMAGSMLTSSTNVMNFGSSSWSY